MDSNDKRTRCVRSACGPCRWLTISTRAPSKSSQRFRSRFWWDARSDGPTVNGISNQEASGSRFWVHFGCRTGCLGPMWI